MSAALVFLLLGTQERVRSRRGKQAISVTATEVLYHYYYISSICVSFFIFF